MDLGFGAYQSQEQSQVLSPRMMQSLKVLQMPSTELYEYLVKEIEGNPVIAFDSLDIAEKSRRGGKRETDTFDPAAIPGGVAEDNSPQLSLKLQLAMLKPDSGVELLCRQLIGMLDENGYLDRADLELHAMAGSFSRMELNEATRLLQSLEPAGVGAFSLRECILLQLERKELSGSDAWIIARDHLDLLAKNQLPQIARKSGIPLHRVVNAKALIRTLNPRPLVSEAASRTVEYVTPDMRIFKSGMGFSVELNQLSADNIVIDDTYSRIYNETDNETVRKYLEENLRKARWLRGSLRQRCETLMNCATALLKNQRSFFEYGPPALKPYSRRDMAEELLLSESTISRAFKNKFVECDWGMFAADYFFPKPSSDDQSDITRIDLEILIQEIIDSEDSSKPLSDEQVAEQLSERGVTISRRTVAKYRDELGIPPSSRRKLYE